MPTDRQLDGRISRWLEAEAPMQLPDRVLRATFERTRKTRQEGRWQAVLWRVQMNRLIIALGGAATVVVAAVVALNLLSNQPRVGDSPTPSPGPSATLAVAPTVEPTTPPTASPPPSATPRTYSANPLPEPNDSLTLMVTLPERWSPDGLPTFLGPAGQPGNEPPGGMFILFDDVTTLNGDPCNWSGTDDDVSVGPAVEDLVEALRAQTAYEVSDAVDVTIGGYGGKRVDIVHPTDPFPGGTSTAPECDEGNFRLWSTTNHGIHPIYAQGAANRWQTNILDVDGTRLVIVVADFPGTLPDDRAEMNAIIESLVIEP